MPSPRTRGPLTPGGIDGVLSGGGDSWMARRRASAAGNTPRGDDPANTGGGEKIKEEDETGADNSDNWRAKAPRTAGGGGGEGEDVGKAVGKDVQQPVANGACTYNNYVRPAEMPGYVQQQPVELGGQEMGVRGQGGSMVRRCRINV